MTATERLQSLLAVEAAATPGPWWTTRDLQPAGVFAGDGGGEDPLIAVKVNSNDARLIVGARNSLRPLAQAILDVLELHRPIIVPRYDGFGTVGYQTCEICRHDNYPCPTVQAITKHLGAQ